MEAGKGVVKHILLAKFKEDVTPKDANLVSLKEPKELKTFHWGRDVSIENFHQGVMHFWKCGRNC